MSNYNIKHAYLEAILLKVYILIAFNEKSKNYLKQRLKHINPIIIR